MEKTLQPLLKSSPKNLVEKEPSLLASFRRLRCLSRADYSLNYFGEPDETWQAYTHLNACLMLDHPVIWTVLKTIRYL